MCVFCKTHIGITTDDIYEDAFDLTLINWYKKTYKEGQELKCHQCSEYFAVVTESGNAHFHTKEGWVPGWLH